MDELLTEIAAFMSKHGLSEYKFGELARNDRHLVGGMRRGRELRRSTEAELRQWMADYQPERKAA